MPVVLQSSYKPPFFRRNPHVQTILPSLFRRVKGIAYERQRIATRDGDFLDLDWSKVSANKLVIIGHGLEGDSQRPYVLGMVRVFNAHGFDTLSWNFRGCSGQPNQLLRFTHSGASEDLHEVVDFVLQNTSYTQIYLVGFSVGGNITLKYLGERQKKIDPRLQKAVAISVPCDLADCAQVLAAPRNKIYMLRFLRQLRVTMAQKEQLDGQRVNLKGYGKLNNFYDFDERYTAPLHGFADAHAYWRASSSKNVLADIGIPTLMISAQDDPFLGRQSYPFDQAHKNSNLFLEVPRYGGHVGFISTHPSGYYWSELRSLEFFQESSC